MTDQTELNGKSEDQPHDSGRISKKEFAKAQRRRAYDLAEERRKADPRYIALQEKFRDQRREAYGKAKERAKARKAEQKSAEKASADNDRVTKRNNLMASIVTANELMHSADQ